MENTFDYQHILRHLDVLVDNFDAYMEHLFVNSSNVVKRNTSVCYYDCTNYFFECEHEDDVYVDPVTGEIFRGLRKYGPSKEHRPTPIVQMVLFMDGNGIPISMCINPGSQNEQLSAVPLEHKITKMFGSDKFIYCADGGLGSYPIRQYNSMGERAYIVTQSVKKLSKVMKEAIFADCDYRRKSNNEPMTVQGMKEFDRTKDENRELYDDKVYKVLVADRAVDTGLTEIIQQKNGKYREQKVQGQLKQYIIVSFSRKMLEYQRYIRNAQIARAQKLLETKDPEMIKKGPNDVTRFIKRTSVGADGKKATDSYIVDTTVIEEEEKYDGYYAIATNLDPRKHNDASRILDISANRYKIEDCFRVLKTNFEARPAYVSEHNHIIGHFITCYTALLVYRLLEAKLEQTRHHFTTDQILDTLKAMNVMNFQDTFYAATYDCGEVCTALNAAFGLGLDRKYYEPKALNRTLKKILK
jgi:transposase